MFKGKHRLLQTLLAAQLNQVLKAKSLAFAELCCTFGNRSIVPDISVTKLLEEMISQIHQLSPEEQDAIAKRHCVIASRFLAELEDEQQWKSRFTSTTDDQWDEMAAMVRQEIAIAETVSLMGFLVS
jgi:hypothetical protein